MPSPPTNIEPSALPEGVRVERFDGLDVWHRHGDDQNPVGCRVNAGPDSLVKRFPLFAPEFLDDAITFTLSLAPTKDTERGKVVAMAGLVPDERSSKTVHLCYVSVDQEHWDEGHSSQLCKAMVSQLAASGIKRLACTGYSESGLQRLRPVLLRETQAVGMAMSDKAKVSYHLSEQPEVSKPSGSARKFSPH